MRAPADVARADAAPVSRRRARGFTLLEVLLALGLLLVGGVSILSVFTLAVFHKVERRMETKLDLLRPEARTLAQQAVDKAPAGKAPEPLKDVAMSEPGFSVTVTFTPSPNEDPAQVAHAYIAYRGQGLPRGRLPPMWLYRSTLDLK
jgi:type II secretory pathway pseudopilin PulG